MTLRNIDKNFSENFSDLVKVPNDVDYLDDEKGTKVIDTALSILLLRSITGCFLYFYDSIDE